MNKKINAVLAACLVLTGCGAAPAAGPTPAQISMANEQIAAEQTPSSLRALYFDVLTSTEKDYVVRAMRLGLAAAREGSRDLAARVFDQAIRRVEAFQAGAEQAERAKSKFVPEQEKWFKGETYERAALYFYRGLLYWDAGDFGNAAACGKRTELQDISTHEEAQGDWYSAEWLLAYASLWQGDDGTARDALARAEKFSSKQGYVPPPLATDNVLIVGEAGNGPIKTRHGQYGEKLVILEGQIRTQKIVIDLLNQASVATAAAENIYRQASTRGLRQVDYILAGKANFKATTNTLGDVGIVGGAATLATSHDETQSLIGLGMLVAGLVGKGVSAAANPEADTRTWDNLPHSIYLAGLSCPTGTTRISLKALAADGVVLSEVTKEIVISDNQPRAEIWLKLP